MKARAIIILGAALLLGSPCASGQSFLEGLRQVGRQISKHLEENSSSTSQSSSSRQSSTSQEKQRSSQQQQRQQSSRDRQLEQQYEAMLGPDAGKDSETQNPQDLPGLRLPATHTALFAPLGYPVDASWGVRKVKPVMPPMAAAKQVDWVDKMPYIYELDNQSVVDEFLLLDQCKEDGYIERLTPADHRHESIRSELWARASALNDLVSNYNELLDEYADAEEPQWVVRHVEDKLVAVLGSDAYKRTLRSSLVPLFTLKGDFINPETREYFKAHGGYENAVNESLTVWDPHPVKQDISTSVSGQSGFVVSEVGAGATVDIDGVQYVLHMDKNCWAFASEVANTAVAGKDMVIPEYIYYKGRKFPVTSMRGGLFEGTTIKSVKLPNTMTEIPNRAFVGTPITEIVIPSSVKNLQGSVFQNCTKLSKVTFEGDYMEEFSGSFQNCTSLTTVICPRRVDWTSREMFSGCTNLTEVRLPENLKEIPTSMFEGCRKLKKIDVPLTVTKIGMHAFGDCGVTELDLRNVTEFEGFCFSGCKSLKKVILNSALKEDFLMETYDEFAECPLLQVKYENNQYIYPDGFIFVP